MRIRALLLYCIFCALHFSLGRSGHLLTFFHFIRFTAFTTDSFVISRETPLPSVYHTMFHALRSKRLKRFTNSSIDPPALTLDGTPTFAHILRCAPNEGSLTVSLSSLWREGSPPAFGGSFMMRLFFTFLAVYPMIIKLCRFAAAISRETHALSFVLSDAHYVALRQRHVRFVLASRSVANALLFAHPLIGY